MEKLRKRTAAAALFLACGMLLAAFTPARAWFGSGETPAAVSAFSKSDGQGQLITFTKEDFLAGVTGEEELSAIVVSALPSGGTLRLAGRDVRPGEAIEAGRLGALCFVPQIGRDVHTSFEFFPVFSRSGAGETAVKVSLNISDTPHSAPIAVEQTFATYADLALHGTLKAVDPDGGACTFSVERQGKRGTAEIDGADFCYTPNGKSGEDTFTVIATDCFGNRSQPAEICVKVVKRAPRETFTYTDMGDNPAHYAALRLREAGVFSGEIFGSEAFFCPAQTVSRAQFLTMAAAIADLAQPAAAVATGMSDDDSIPAWSRGYVAAGILSGVVKGSDDGQGNRAFRAERAITRAEAAAILDRCLALADDGRPMTFDDAGSVPAWSVQSVVNTTAAGLLPVYADNTVRPYDPVTREEAAVMLYGMLCRKGD